MPVQRPNFVLLIGEDTGRYLGCYGDEFAHTPHLDRLASEGCRFDQAYSTAPVCSPSRSTLVTGQYQFKIGTHQHRSVLKHPPRLFTHELRDAGYHVSWPTKQDFNFKPTAGWRDESESWLVNLRSGFVPDRPWLGCLNIGVTHESSMWPPDTDRDGGTAPAYLAKPSQRPPRHADPDRVPVPPYLPDTPRVRADIARHYDNIRALDELVGEVLDLLDTTGQLDNTVVLFLADHGRGLPREKRWPYTAGLHMPLIVRGPGIDAGSTSDQLVSWVDIAPTILSLADVQIPSSYDGQPIIGAETSSMRDYIFAGRDRMDEAFDRVRIIRNRRYHYVHNFYPMIPYAQRNAYMELMPTMQEMRRLHAAGELPATVASFMQPSKPKQELYDLQHDPLCMHNLSDNPAFASVCESLASELDEFLHGIDDMGAVAERELFARGSHEDVFPALRELVVPLPPEQRVGLPLTILDPADIATT